MVCLKFGLLHNSDWVLRNGWNPDTRLLSVAAIRAQTSSNRSAGQSTRMQCINMFCGLHWSRKALEQTYSIMQVYPFLPRSSQDNWRMGSLKLER